MPELDLKIRQIQGFWLIWNWNGKFGKSGSEMCLRSKVGKYRDRVSVEPGSQPFCDSVSVSIENVWVSSLQKILFANTNDTLDVSTNH